MGFGRNGLVIVANFDHTCACLVGWMGGGLRDGGDGSLGREK